MPVADATFLIGLERRRPPALAAMERIGTAGPLVVPAHAALEYLSGMDDRPAELARLVASFLVRHSSDAMLLAAADLRARARALGGEKPHWGDIHIAAIAVLEGTYVLTTNKRHFTALGVPAWNYETEPDPPVLR